LLRIKIFRDNFILQQLFFIGSWPANTVDTNCRF